LFGDLLLIRRSAAMPALLQSCKSETVTQSAGVMLSTCSCHSTCLWVSALCVRVCVQKQGRFEVYEGDAQPPMSPPVGQGQQFMDQNLGSKPTTPEHGA